MVVAPMGRQEKAADIQVLRHGWSHLKLPAARQKTNAQQASLSNTNAETPAAFSTPARNQCPAARRPIFENLRSPSSFMLYSGKH